MRSALRVGALAVGLISVAGLAARDRIDNALSSTAVQTPVEPDDAVTGSIGRLPEMQALGLNDEQRGWIFLGIINLPDVPDVDLASQRFSAPLPTSVELHDLPAMVTRKVPTVKDVRFVKLDDRILLVRPADRLVVGEIPRYRVWQ